jgi:hypothetical protein
MCEEDVCFAEPRPGELLMDPEAQMLPFVGSELVSSKEYTNWLKGEPSRGNLLRSVCFIDHRLSQVIHLTVELSLSREVAVSPPIILVSLNVGVVPCKC